MNSGDFNLLIVDDNQLIINTLRSILSEVGYTVYFSLSATDALVLLEEHHIDLVISDFRMPGMDGLALLRIIKEKYVDSKVILYTATELDVERCRILGAFEVLEKPSEIDTILMTVEKALYAR